MPRYTGAHTKNIRFPLGGIGAGSVSLSGEGRLVDWEIFNHPNKGSFNSFSHFAVKASRGGNLLDARVLNGDLTTDLSGQPAGLPGHTGFGYGPARTTMAGFPHFSDIIFDGTFPTARLTFADPHFPGMATLDAWSPMIPLEDNDSSLPAACFTLSAHNPTDAAVDYTFAFSVGNPARSGSANLAVPGGVRLTDTVLPSNDPAFGELCVLTDAESCGLQRYWYRGSWFDAAGIYWRNFTAPSPMPERVYDADKKCGGDMATLYTTLTAAPGETVSARFVLAWYYPNRINDWTPQQGDRPWRNWYATRWTDAFDAARYLLAHWERLRAGTYAFRDALHNSTLPPEVIDAAASNLAVLRSPTVLRLEDGTFYGWEGVSEHAGSCEGTCTHVWTYTYALCYLFPSLERSIRDADYKYNLEPSGYMTFRLPLPLGRKNPRFHACVDGQMGGIIKVYREWKLSGDGAWLACIYPSVKKALSFAWSPENGDAWDADRDGILEGRQHHTLDMELFGPSSWLEGFYLAALRAGSEMARYTGDFDFAELCDTLYANGKNYLEERLFNGKWYIQNVDLTDKSIAERFDCVASYWNEEAGELKYQICQGSSIDQLLAQYHAALCGLGDIFDPTHRKTALMNMFRHNFKPSMREYYNPCRVFCSNDEGGAVICDYPEGAYKPVVPIPYAEECMTGFEYAFAVLLCADGFVDEGLTVVRAIRDRYNGEKRNPYNEIECGSNYARSMASFALLPALEGFSVDLPAGKIGVHPRVDGPLRAFFSAGTAWGELTADADAVSLRILGGSLRLSGIACPALSDIAHLTADGQALAFTHMGDGAAFESVTLHDSLTVSRI
ncbi:MAG: GH116 family glycosyl-hydrolase [Clostridiaceae bacterium]|nr:GH116 family glycosyl-hydrolase [Clostridiaceae bacterium]